MAFLEAKPIFVQPSISSANKANLQVRFGFGFEKDFSTCLLIFGYKGIMYFSKQSSPGRVAEWFGSRVQLPARTATFVGEIGNFL